MTLQLSKVVHFGCPGQPGEVLHLSGERGLWESGPAGYSSDLRVEWPKSKQFPVAPSCDIR